ncbi:hypothetical protein BDZ89DRAFT_1137704 [Hymenopellis radicata]|nr:hypothetical protein BDZ89DRAFT_1137704 [Hymenopellis radicata]
MSSSSSQSSPSTTSKFPWAHLKNQTLRDVLQCFGFARRLSSSSDIVMFLESVNPLVFKSSLPKSSASPTGSIFPWHNLQESVLHTILGDLGFAGASSQSKGHVLQLLSNLENRDVAELRTDNQYRHLISTPASISRPSKRKIDISPAPHAQDTQEPKSSNKRKKRTTPHPNHDQSSPSPPPTQASGPSNSLLSCRPRIDHSSISQQTSTTHLRKPRNPSSRRSTVQSPTPPQVNQESSPPRSPSSHNEQHRDLDTPPINILVESPSPRSQSSYTDQLQDFDASPSESSSQSSDQDPFADDELPKYQPPELEDGLQHAAHLPHQDFLQYEPAELEDGEIPPQDQVDGVPRLAEELDTLSRPVQPYVFDTVIHQHSPTPPPQANASEPVHAVETPHSSSHVHADSLPSPQVVLPCELGVDHHLLKLAIRLIITLALIPHSSHHNYTELFACIVITLCRTPTLACAIIFTDSLPHRKAIIRQLLREASINL